MRPRTIAGTRVKSIPITDADFQRIATSIAEHFANGGTYDDCVLMLRRDEGYAYTSAENLMKKVYSHFGLDNRVMLVAYAFRRGWIT